MSLTPSVNKLCGVGMRTAHFEDILNGTPKVGWFEVHSENFFSGIPLMILQEVAKNFPISLHGVGLSLGSAEGLDKKHLLKLKKLVDTVDPFLISEHLSWSVHENIYFNDLYPLPYTSESLEILKRNIDTLQQTLGRKILFENPSSYLEYKTSTYEESDFLNLLAEKTGASILLDINNVYVSSKNHGFCAKAYIENIEKSFVGEYHLAGHHVNNLEEGKVIHIDTHNTNICDEVWDLYNHALTVLEPAPTLIEWDSALPPFSALEEECAKAQQYLNKKQQQITHEHVA